MPGTLIYSYDAYCSWCFGFSPVLQKIGKAYEQRLLIEVLSGGMILTEQPVPLSATAGFLQETSTQVEALTGIRFGKDYLWHIENPELSDWFPHSEKPALALIIFKEYHPHLQVAFATDIQYALFSEGRDLTDDEAYRHLLEKYQLPAEEFYYKLHHPSYKEKAYEDFSIVKQLKVSGYPTLMLQDRESRFYLVSRGYASFNEVKLKLDKLLTEGK